MGTQAHFIHHPAKHCGQKRAGEITCNTGQVRISDKKHVNPQQQTRHQGDQAVHKATAKNDAKTRAAHSGRHNLLHSRLRTHGTDFLQPSLQLRQIALSLRHLP